MSILTERLGSAFDLTNGVLRSHLATIIILIMAVAGAMTGSIILYSIGAWADDKVVRKLIDRWGQYIGIDQQGLDRAFEMFERYGAPILIVGRSIPLIRVAVTLVAGMSGMSLPKYLFFSMIQSTGATFLYIGSGVLVGRNWREVVRFAEVSPGAAILLATVIIAFVTWWWFRRRRRTGEDDIITATLLDTQEVQRTPEPEM